MVYVEVDDIPGHLGKAESLGGKTMVPETEVPGQGWFAWLTDPAGNQLGLWKPAPAADGS
jgi:predicted enzyme related to lactoylglutathione lyase